MKLDEILRYCLENLEGSVLVESWGEKGIFYNPGRVLNPSEETFEALRQYIRETYEYAKEKFAKRKRNEWKRKGRIWNE